MLLHCLFRPRRKLLDIEDTIKGIVFPRTGLPMPFTCGLRTRAFSRPAQQQMSTCAMSHMYRRSCWHMPKQRPCGGAVTHSGRMCSRVVWLSERATRAQFRVPLPVQERLSSGTRAQASNAQPRAHHPLCTRLLRMYWITSGPLPRRRQSVHSRRRTAQGCMQDARLAPRGLLSAPVHQMKFFPHNRPSLKLWR